MTLDALMEGYTLPFLLGKVAAGLGRFTVNLAEELEVKVLQMALFASGFTELCFAFY